jgi:hypothetical protein
MFFWKIAKTPRRYRTQGIKITKSFRRRRLLRAFPFFVFLDAGTFSSAGIAVGFVVAAANRVVLHGADAVGFGVLHTFVGFAGKSEGQKAHGAERKPDVFHK